MKKVLKKLWTLPQDILGAILVKVFKGEKIVIPYYMNTNCYIAKRLNGVWAGVSLGNYIIFSNDVHFTLDSLKHEYGHMLQSKKLGWLYLIVIGLPSFIGNLYDRIAHRNWSSIARYKWYYSQPWEKWADNLGGVTR